MLEVLELISIALTVAVIILSIEVVKQWFPSVRRSVARKKSLTAEEWLILGVFVSFVGGSFDNSYWLTAWSSFYIDSTSSFTHTIMSNGFLANIPFRQITGIFAAYCHLNAAVLYSTDGKKHLKNVMLIAIVLGFSYSLLLLFL